jgi:hypothetical protein
MGVFFLIVGLLLAVISTFIQVKICQSKDKYVANTSCRKFPGVVFFQLLGLFWIFLGITFTLRIITYPKGGWGILLDILVFGGPVWAFAFYLERKKQE